jgi:hypothetical protein
LQDLFNCADGPKFLQVIYTPILQSQTTLSLGWMLEYWKRISVFNKSTWKELKFLRQLKMLQMADVNILMRLSLSIKNNRDIYAR